MTIQQQKINFVQEVLRINDKDILDKLQTLLHQEKENLYHKKFVPMTMDEFNNRVAEAEEDYANGRTTDVDVLSDEIKKWK